jgi:predicted nucleic acid-binding protein
VNSGTSDKAFIDTNVLIYAHDVDAGVRHDRACDLLRVLWRDGTGVLSPQVLQEFYVNDTRKIPKPLAASEARRVVDAYAVWCVDGIGPGDIRAAFRIEDEAHVGFWDALIVAVAARSGACRLLTEDLNDGQVIAGVTVTNPFTERPRSRGRR